MAIIQYNSGVVEDVKSKGPIFDDKELLEFFPECDKIRSRRIAEVPNSWGIWGEKTKTDVNEFNALGTRIVQEKIFSPLLVLHDSELNPDKNLTDRIILKPYKQFKQDILLFFDDIAREIIGEAQNHQSESGFSSSPITPNLKIIGPTADKRALLEFDPLEQKEGFYDFENFSIFSSNAFGYLHAALNVNLGLEKNSFIIHADNKSIIIVRDELVNFIMEKVLKNFEKREKYTGCSHILLMGKKWTEYIKNNKSPMTKKWEEYQKSEKKDGKAS